jgi:hypothetical protein
VFFQQEAFSQVIRGRVLEKDSGTPVGFAYLYFSGTFNGTQTDASGNFELDVSKYSNLPLTISAVGYYSNTLNDFSIRKFHTVYLTPKLYMLSEVTVRSKSLARKRYENMRIFKDEFLGKTSNAGSCVILNENDITFNYNTDRDTLKAFALKPILVDNRALGYSITYYLDKFEYIRESKSFNFKGNIVFKEDLSVEAEDKSALEKRRRFAYLGSRMNFFRSMWYNELKSSGFVIRNSNNKVLSYRELVIEHEGNKYLKYGEPLLISYYSRVLSILNFLDDSIYFRSDGYFDPAAATWEGELAIKRIADWLPYEYAPVE